MLTYRDGWDQVGTERFIEMKKIRRRPPAGLVEREVVLVSRENMRDREIGSMSEGTFRISRPRRGGRIALSAPVALLAAVMVCGLATGCSSMASQPGSARSGSTTSSPATPGGEDEPGASGGEQSALKGKVVRFGSTAELIPNVFVKLSSVRQFKASDPPKGCDPSDHYFKYSVSVKNRKKYSFSTLNLSLLPVDPDSGETRKDTVYGSDNGIPMDRVPWWSPVANGYLVRPGATSKFLFGACTDLDLDDLVIEVEYPNGSSMSEWARVYFRK